MSLPDSPVSVLDILTRERGTIVLAEDIPTTPRGRHARPAERMHPATRLHLLACETYPRRAATP